MSLHASNLSHEDLSASLNRLSLSANLPANLSLNHSAQSSSTMSKQLNNSNSSTNSSSNSNPPSSSSAYSILKIRNIPKDVTLREAFLIFSLCLDDVCFVDILQDTNNSNPVIFSKFYSAKIASQVFQLLNSKNLFGSAFPKVQCELSHETNNEPSTNPVTNNYLFSNPFTSSGTQQSAHSPTTPKAENTNFSENSNAIINSNAGANTNTNTNTLTAVGTKTTINGNNNNNLNNNTNDPLHSLNNISIINTAAGNVTGWSNDTSTPLATPSNNSKTIRPDNLILTNLNPASHSASKLNSSDLTTHPNTPGHQLHTPLLNEWNSNGYFMSDISTPINGHFQQQNQGQSQQQQHQQPSHMENISQANTLTEDVLNMSNMSSHSPTHISTLATSSNTNSAQLSQQQQQQQQQQKSLMESNGAIPDLSLLARVPPPANPADQNPPCNTLYVGNLPPDTSENELRSLFRPQPGFKRLSFRTKQTNGVSSHHGPMCFVEFEDVAYATKALAELYGRTLPRQNGSSNNKGGIRLSFSKNPLGVRGPGQQRRNLPNSSNISSNSTSNSNISNGQPQLGQVSIPGVPQSSTTSTSMSSNTNQPAMVTRQSSAIANGSVNDTNIAPSYQRTNSLPLQVSMGLNGMNNLNNMNMMNSMNAMQGMNGISNMNSMNNMNNIGMGMTLNTMNGMNMNGLNFSNGLNLGINGYEFMNQGQQQQQQSSQEQAQQTQQQASQQQQTSPQLT